MNLDPVRSTISLLPSHLNLENRRSTLEVPSAYPTPRIAVRGLRYVSCSTQLSTAERMYRMLSKVSKPCNLWDADQVAEIRPPFNSWHL